MRLFSTLRYVVIACLAFVHQTFDLLACVVTDLVMTPFRQVYAETRRHVERFATVAYQLIRPLKPEYRESYRTHGLSLTAGHPA